MAVAKLTMIFNQGLYGWTENYWRDGASSDLIDEMNKALILAPKRIACSGEDTYITYLKVSNESIARDVRLYNYFEATGNVLAGESGKNSDTRFTAALIKRQNANRTASSNLLMRGIWDEIIIAGGGLAPNPAWRSKFNEFRGTLISGLWGFMAKNVPASLSKKLISNITQNVDGKIVITTAAAFFPVDTIGKKVKVFISGIPGAVLVNGVQIVIPTSTTVATTIKRIPILPYLGGGLITYNELQFVAVNDAIPLRCVSRKTGRPPYLSAGRSRVRKLS